jgi:hypothetical protein
LENKLKVLPTIKLEDNKNNPSTLDWAEISNALQYFAKMQWSYFSHLKLEGFTEEQALQVISGYHPLRSKDRE